MCAVLVLLMVICIIRGPLSVNAIVDETDLNELSEQQNSIVINKCCESNELMVDSVCRLADKYNLSTYVQLVFVELHFCFYQEIY